MFSLVYFNICLLNPFHISQLKLLDSMLSKMMSVFTESQSVLTSSSLDITQGKLPEEQKDRTALALVLENTCLASDILLRFPDYMLKKLAKGNLFQLKRFVGRLCHKPPYKPF